MYVTEFVKIRFPKGLKHPGYEFKSGLAWARHLFEVRKNLCPDFRAFLDLPGVKAVPVTIQPKPSRHANKRPYQERKKSKGMFTEPLP